MICLHNDGILLFYCSNMNLLMSLFLIITMWQHKILVTAPICYTSFFLFILKCYGLVKLLMFYVIGFEFLKLVVSTSSVVWSQVRWFFILEYFHAINHGERIKSFRISSMFYCLYYYPI